ncbi:hypothetical protein AVEN_47180-1 [Araneus ventricosus]|uniref:Uncharacterized protein n=1 Tax=Araneus ventricosus TaxID=182803 RepID=A0A4Y2EFW3_ARAVE|nr:hypothetical protein AVEN_47180-1 [Araneus ventricosus]
MYFPLLIASLTFRCQYLIQQKVGCAHRALMYNKPAHKDEVMYRTRGPPISKDDLVSLKRSTEGHRDQGRHRSTTYVEYIFVTDHIKVAYVILVAKRYGKGFYLFFVKKSVSPVLLITDLLT